MAGSHGKPAAQPRLSLFLDRFRYTLLAAGTGLVLLGLYTPASPPLPDPVEQAKAYSPFHFAILSGYQACQANLTPSADTACAIDAIEEALETNNPGDVLRVYDDARIPVPDDYRELAVLFSRAFSY